MTRRDVHDSGSGEQPGGERGWPGQFPHLEIDALLQRLQEEPRDPAEVQQLLTLVSREALRLRTSVARLAATRLADARDEASGIVQDAHDHADELRQAGLEALARRLEEAQTVSAALRHEVARERRAGSDREERSRGDEQ